MAQGSPAPVDRSDSASHINPTYDSDEDGVVELARSAEEIVGGSAGIIDRAETFAESDVTMTNTRTVLENEGVVFTDSFDERIDTPANHTQTYGSTQEKMGVRFTPNVPVQGVSLRLKTDSDGYSSGNAWTEVVLYNVTDDVEVTKITDGSADINPRNTQTLTGFILEAGKQYEMYGWAGGSNYRCNYYSSFYNDSPADFGPYAGTYATVDSYAEGYTSVSGERCLIDWFEIDIIPQDGSLTVEWPYPTDVYSWDRAYFDADEPGTSAVNVYAEAEQTAGTWTEVAGPLQRGDTIPADPENNIRYRIDFERTGTTDEPRLESIYRRRVV